MIYPCFSKRVLSRAAILSLFVSASMFLSGCTALAVGSAVVATTTVARQDKGIATSIDDVKLTIRASNVLNEEGLGGYVKVRVNEGHALLIGNVKKLSDKKLAGRLVESIPGVVGIENQIRIKQNSEKLSDELSDLRITSSIKAKFALSPDVRYGNYTVTTMDKIVYIIGVYHDKSELQTVLSIASNVSGVRQVVSYLEPANK